MAQNPHPSHITPEMWWFIGQLDLLDGPDTVFAGAWGDFKPGGHCDAFNLYWHKDKSGAYSWRNDYTTRLPDDKVMGTDLQHFGAAVDLTFRSAQNGDFRTIRKYGSRVRAAWIARDPRLKGWREVLIQGDSDAPADRFDFVSWAESTSDITHTWHGHWTALRKYLRQIQIYQAMLSILRGETLAQWLAGGDEMSVNTFWLNPDVHGKGEDGFWISSGGWRERIGDNDDMAKAKLAHPGLIPLPGADHNGWPSVVLPWTIDEVNRICGRRRDQIPSGGGGVTMDEVNAAIAGSTIQPGGDK
jgi:hypothetical protein